MKIVSLNTSKAFVEFSEGENYPEAIRVVVDKARNFKKRTCKNCGNVFYSRKKLEFCSQECKTKDITLTLNCSECGKVIYRTKADYERSKNKMFFCSRECKDKGQSIEGNCPEIRPDHYGDGKWSYAERALRISDECAICGETNKDFLVVHHVDKNRDNADIDNLQVLCANCHTRLHRLGL